MDDSSGIWRTVGGRRIFIKDGEDLASAMKNSGKFESSKTRLDVLKHRRALNSLAVGRKDKEEIERLDKEIEEEKEKLEKLLYHRKKLLENSVGRKDY